MSKIQIKNIGSAVYLTGRRGDWDVAMWIQFHGLPSPEYCSVRTGAHPEAFYPLKLRDDAREIRNKVLSAMALGRTVYVESRRLSAVVPFSSISFKRSWAMPKAIDEIFKEQVV